MMAYTHIDYHWIINKLNLYKFLHLKTESVENTAIKLGLLRHGLTQRVCAKQRQPWAAFLFACKVEEHQC